MKTTRENNMGKKHTGQLSLSFAWGLRIRLWAEGDKLRAEGDKLWAERHDLHQGIIELREIFEDARTVEEARR